MDVGQTSAKPTGLTPEACLMLSKLCALKFQETLNNFSTTTFFLFKMFFCGFDKRAVSNGESSPCLLFASRLAQRSGRLDCVAG